MLKTAFGIVSRLSVATRRNVSYVIWRQKNTAPTGTLNQFGGLSKLSTNIPAHATISIAGVKTQRTGESLVTHRK